MSSPATVVAIRAHPGSLTMLFGTDGVEVPVTVGLQPTTEHALRHLYALHAHASGCHASPAVQLHVDLLIRSLRCLGGRAACVLVRPGRYPAFWLRIAGPDRTDDLPLDVLDATCLLMSRRVPVVLLDRPAADWDDALRQLVADQDG